MLAGILKKFVVHMKVLHKQQLGSLGTTTKTRVQVVVNFDFHIRYSNVVDNKNSTLDIVYMSRMA
jgi:hypothetical protein